MISLLTRVFVELDFFLPVVDGRALGAVGIGFAELVLQVVDLAVQYGRGLPLCLLVGLELLDAPMM